MIGVVRRTPPNGHGAAWVLLAARKLNITGWVKDDLSIVKIQVLLNRSTSVPHRTSHRFAVEECGACSCGTTVW